MTRSAAISQALIDAADAAFARLNDSPTQRMLREQKFWFSGPVLWHPGAYDVAHLTREMRRMRELGFNAVRFHNADPEEAGPNAHDFSRTDDWMNAAADAGIGVILQPDTALTPGPRTLAAHGFDLAGFQAAYADDPAWLECVRAWLAPIVRRLAPHPNLIAWGANGEGGVGRGRLTGDTDRRRFVRWLQGRYASLDALDAAWNIYAGPRGKRPARRIADSWDDAPNLLDGFDADPQINGVHHAKLNYGAARDLLRFLTDKQIDRLRAMAGVIKESDPAHPVMLGTHLLAANQPAYLWDNPAVARAGDGHQTSIHLAWHFEGVEGEIDRPVYLQSRLTRDYFKNGFTSAYETTGGPVQYSGGHGNAMTAGLMRRLCLAYLAAGNLSMAFWTWNARPGGWESGEYGLTSLSGAITPWAVEAGRVARAMGRYAAELWEARQAAPVGVLEDWDTQAILSLEPQRHDLPETRDGTGTAQQFHRALVGVGRALVNHRVPFEVLTAAELRDERDLVFRYPTIYVPHARAPGDDVFALLARYVEAGGRLIADVQMGFQDQHGKLRPTGAGGAQEKLFGAYVDAIHDARTTPMIFNGAPIDGFFADLVPTRAAVLARFADGAAAVTETHHGKGTAVLIGFDAARMCHRPGQAEVERLIARLARPGPAAWACCAPLAFRLEAPGADHYFLMNDGPARTVFLSMCDRTYSSGELVLEETAISLDGTLALALPAHGGLWVRMVHDPEDAKK